MELILSITAVIVSIATLAFTIVVEYRRAQREKKQATLDAFNVLQEQVFDKLNTYVSYCRNGNICRNQSGKRWSNQARRKGKNAWTQVV